MRRANYLCLLLVPFPMLAFAGKPEGIAAFERRDYQSAIDELTPAAREGDAEGQYFLARSLKARNGLQGKRPNELDPEQQEAHSWLEKAVKQGYMRAASEYAVDFDTGSGTPINYDAAVDWLKKGAEAGDSEALLRLALWYLQGHIVAPDRTKYEELRAKRRDNSPQGDALEKVAKQTREFANRTRLMQNNIDPDRGARDLRAAQEGDAEAARRVANEASRSDGRQDCAAAAHWYERAGDLGDTSSYVRLGEQYYQGYCQKQDFGRARAFFLKASDSNAARASSTPASLDKLANMEMFGQGQAIDYRAAYLHLKMLEMFSPKWTLYDPGRLNFVRRQLAPEVAAEIDQQATALAAPQVERWKKERAESDARRREQDADREARN
jgi:hypothetical protein